MKPDTHIVIAQTFDRDGIRRTTRSEQIWDREETIRIERLDDGRVRLLLDGSGVWHMSSKIVLSAEEARHVANLLTQTPPRDTNIDENGEKS